MYKCLPLARRNPDDFTVFFCEDHFDLSKPMISYLMSNSSWKHFGSKKALLNNIFEIAIKYCHLRALRF